MALDPSPEYPPVKFTGDKFKALEFNFVVELLKDHHVLLLQVESGDTHPDLEGHLIIGLAAQSDLDELRSDHEDLEDTVEAHAVADDPHGDRAYADALLALKADLVNGIIPTSQLPPLAIIDRVFVDDEEARLDLSSDDVQPGDLVVQSDDSTMWWLMEEDPSDSDNWLRVQPALGEVESVNGYQGVVVLTASDVGAYTTAQVDALLNGKANTSHNHNASHINAGTLVVARGGTGLSSPTAGRYMKTAGSSAFTTHTPAQVLSDIGAASAADLTSHLNDSSDAHDASAISYAGGTGISATDVEGAIDELASEKADASDLTAHINDSFDAHDASAISFSAGGNVSSTNVQDAIEELDTEKAASSHNHAASDITSGTLSVARGGTGLASPTAGSYVKTNGSSAYSTLSPTQVLSDIGAAADDHNHDADYEDAGAVAAHTGDTSDAHDASAISFSATGNIAATDVQAAIEELDTEKAASSHNHSASNITSGTLAVARGGTGISSYTVGNYIRASAATTLQQRTPAEVLSDIGAAASSHDHDSDYAAISHQHVAADIDAEESTVGYVLTSGGDGTASWQSPGSGTHDHDADYSDIAHDHDADYSDIAHDHDSDYAAASHSHNIINEGTINTADRYVRSTTGGALIERTFAEVLSDIGAAASSHNHDAAYAASNHTHPFNQVIFATANRMLRSDGSGNTVERTLAQVRGDIGANNASNITAGTLAVARGGTGISSYTTGNYLRAADTATLEQRTPSEVLSDIGAAASNHNHDATYAASGHDHDSDYAATGHNHDSDYSDIAHDHDSDYAATGHNHSGVYANATHNHAAGDINSGSFSVARGGTGRTSLTSGSYLVGAGTSAVTMLTSAQVLSDIGASASSHNHDSAYASATHDHDEDYASTGHDHDGDYEASGAVAAHTGDSTDAHAASAISFSATGNISSTTVQTAIAELDTEKAASSHNHAASNITSGTLAVNRGGTGQATLTSGSFLVGNGTSAVSLRTAEQVLSDISAVGIATGVVVVDAGSNLSTARPSGAGVVYWMFDSGVDPGASGENITNAVSGDQWFVAD